MKKSTKCFFKKQWNDWKSTVLFIAFVLVPMKSTLADWNWVPTGSMNPTIVEGDLIYVNKLAYDLRFPLTRHSLLEFNNPERGDISVLFSPEDEIRLVKRVVGLPGDEIEMRDNILYINDERLRYEPLPEVEYENLKESLKSSASFGSEFFGTKSHAVMSVPGVLAGHRSFPKMTVPQGQYFVMGDNRDLSKDSRIFGFAARDRFVGKATGVIVSFDIHDKLQPRFGRFFSSLY